MPKGEKMPKEYAIVVSLMIFFTIVILVGGIRIYLVTSHRLNVVDLTQVQTIESNTIVDVSNYNLKIKIVI